MGLLCLARALIAFIPLRFWRNTLGLAANDGTLDASGPLMPAARRLANHVDRAVSRLPFAVKCLGQAMALSWMLRSSGIGHSVVIAVRPAALRDTEHGLHAWVESAGSMLIGELPGPWHEIYRLPESGPNF